MQVCQNCEKQFNTWQWIDGKRHNLQNRKFCIICSPYGSHNTRKSLTRQDKVLPKEAYCPRCNSVKAQEKFRLRGPSRGNGRSQLHGWCKICEDVLGKEKREADRRTALEHYSDTDYARCTCCKEARIEFLGLDHTSNDGRQHRDAIHKVGSNFYSWLNRTKFSYTNLVTMCHNCNLSRGHYGYCPHERE